MWNKIKGLFKLSPKEYASNVYRTAAEYKIIKDQHWIIYGGRTYIYNSYFLA